MDRKLLGLRERPDPPPSIDLRHLRRLIQSILIETRTTRQYIMWLHEMLANHELGKEAELPTGKELKETFKNRDLTPEEQQRLAAGEDVEDVVDFG
jgi:hypothetical protein